MTEADHVFRYTNPQTVSTFVRTSSLMQYKWPYVLPWLHPLTSGQSPALWVRGEPCSVSFKRRAAPVFFKKDPASVPVWAWLGLSIELRHRNGRPCVLIVEAPISYFRKGYSQTTALLFLITPALKVPPVQVTFCINIESLSERTLHIYSELNPKSRCGQHWFSSALVFSPSKPYISEFNYLV